ncbi:MAG: tRNA-dihydrouridine synthase family protein [Thermodesulfovibrionales bacterium]
MNLPWNQTTKPLMLAPMQGITNCALRSLFVEWVRPDVVFTEFVRVRPGSKQPLSNADLREVTSIHRDVPLVVQLVGRDQEALVAAAQTAQDQGARHININMGCPQGRMTSGAGGGALLKYPSCLPDLLRAVRSVVHGSLSVKIRSGYDTPGQIFTLLPMFEDVGVDFLILHARTVKEKYGGQADHTISTAVVKQTTLPVIVNGDINSAAKGNDVLNRTNAAGLMLGRGAIGSPLLFQRLRGNCSVMPSREERVEELVYYLRELVSRYQKIFHGNTQILYKLKEVVCFILDTDFAPTIKAMKRSRTMEEFLGYLDQIG